jgi:hypothetical protein
MFFIFQIQIKKSEMKIIQYRYFNYQLELKIQSK